MIRCMIVDDEFDAVDILTQYVKQTPMLQLVQSTTDPLEALKIVASEQIDLIFLDIQMPKISGIEFLKAINGKAKVIFTTAYSEFAVEAYNLDVVDYLLKPIPFSRFLAAVQRAAKQLNRSDSLASEVPLDYMFVKTETKGKLLKVVISEIDFIEAKNNYVALHMGKNKVLVYASLKELEERLNANEFIRVHKSYIVPLHRISGIEGNKLILNIPVDITVGESYKAALMERINNSMLE